MCLIKRLGGGVIGIKLGNVGRRNLRLETNGAYRNDRSTRAQCA